MIVIIMTSTTMTPIIHPKVWPQTLLSLSSQSHPTRFSFHLAGFSTPFWRNTVVLSLLAVGFYKWAPSPNQDVYLTQWLAQLMEPRDFWAAINEKHLLLSQQASDNTILQADAQRPSIHRYRYPQ